MMTCVYDCAHLVCRCLQSLAIVGRCSGRRPEPPLGRTLLLLPTVSVRCASTSSPSHKTLPQLLLPWHLCRGFLSRAVNFKFWSTLNAHGNIQSISHCSVFFLSDCCFHGHNILYVHHQSPHHYCVTILPSQFFNLRFITALSSQGRISS
jgi:hypothetical protein